MLPYYLRVVRRLARPVDGAGETGYSLGLTSALLSSVFFGPVAARLLRVPLLFRHSGYVNAPVAQWIEYCPPKAGVAGSIPAGRAIRISVVIP